MTCPECRAELASDAKFCIECGAPVPAAAAGTPAPVANTSSTVPLAGQDGTRCPACNVRNPAIAMFCVNCGRALHEETAAPAQQPATPRRAEIADASRPPPLSIPPAPDLPAHRRPDRAAPLPAGPALPSRTLARTRGMNPATLGGLTGGLFLIGLAFLFATGTFFPGILVLLGLTGFLGSAAGGKARVGLIPLIFMCGLAFLFATNTIFPGILVLLGIIAIISPILASDRR